MSSQLGVEPGAGPIERTAADLAVVGIFASERPLRDGAGRADWRLCGQLSALLVQGRLTGAWGEALLAPTFGGLAAPLLLALGLGEPEAFGLARCSAFAREAARRGLALGAGSLALALPPGDPLLRDRAEALAAGAAEALAEVGGELRVRIVAHGEEAARVGAATAGIRPAALPRSVSLRPVAASRGPAPGGPEAAPPVK